MSRSALEIKEIELKAQYRILSEIESEFGYNTKHKVASFVYRRMVGILDELSKIKLSKIKKQQK
jgi:hypothetical protein